MNVSFDNGGEEVMKLHSSPKANDMECDGLPSLSFLAPKGANAGGTPALPVSLKDCNAARNAFGSRAIARKRTA